MRHTHRTTLTNPGTTRPGSGTKLHRLGVRRMAWMGLPWMGMLAGVSLLALGTGSALAQDEFAVDVTDPNVQVDLSVLNDGGLGPRMSTPVPAATTATAAPATVEGGYRAPGPKPPVSTLYIQPSGSFSLPPQTKTLIAEPKAEPAPVQAAEVPRPPQPAQPEPTPAEPAMTTPEPIDIPEPPAEKLAAPEPVSTPAPQPEEMAKAEAGTEPAPEPTPPPAPVAEAEPEPAPEPTPPPAPVVEAEPEPAPAPKPQPEELAKAEPAAPASPPSDMPPPPPQALSSDDAAAAASPSKQAAPPAAPKPPAELSAEAQPAPPPTPPASPNKVTVDLPPKLESPSQAGVAALPPATDGVSEQDGMRIVFEADSSKLPGSARDALATLAKRLEGDDTLRLQLLAYAGDADTSASAARRLSLSRALAVRSFLIENGVRSTRIDVRALGNKSTDAVTERVDVNVMER